MRHLEVSGCHQRLCIRRASFWPFTALRLHDRQALVPPWTPLAHAFAHSRSDVDQAQPEGSITSIFHYTENGRHDTRELGSRCHNGRRFLANPRLPQPQRDCRRGTAVVVNYLTGALLAFDHLSMRGDNPYELERICDCELRCEPWDLACDGTQVLKGAFAGTPPRPWSPPSCTTASPSWPMRAATSRRTSRTATAAAISRSRWCTAARSRSASLLCGNHASRWAGRMYGAVVKAHACVAVDESRSWLAARCVSFYQDVYLSVCLSALKRVAAVGATNS